MSNLRDTKCGRCGCWRKTEDFISNERVVKCCVNCRDIQKTYADKNREKINERQKKYDDKNRDKIEERQKQWRIDNPEYNKQFRDSQKQIEPLLTKFKNMIRSSKSNDKKNNLQITEDYITLDYLNQLWIFQNGLCYYEDCNVELTLDFNKSCRTPTQISIQRHDNNICHSQNNTCLSCFNCNVNKHKEREHFTEILIATNKLAVE